MTSSPIEPPSDSRAAIEALREAGLIDSFPCPLYERCADPDCPVAYAYRAPFPDADHWHHRG